MGDRNNNRHTRKWIFSTNPAPLTAVIHESRFSSDTFCDGFHMFMFNLNFYHFHMFFSHFWGDTVDGRNPAPPGMYKNPVNNVINYLSLNWLAGFLNHQQYVHSLTCGVCLNRLSRASLVAEGTRFEPQFRQELRQAVHRHGTCVRAQGKVTRTDEVEVKTWRVSSMSSMSTFFNPPKTHEKKIIPA